MAYTAIPAATGGGGGGLPAGTGIVYGTAGVGSIATAIQVATSGLGEYSTTLGAAATQISLTGLNGDADGIYQIQGELRIAVSSNLVQFLINNQNANFKSIPANLFNGATRRTDFYIAATGLGQISFTSGDVIYINGFLYAKSGRARKLSLRMFADLASDDCYTLDGIWTVTATNVTEFDALGTQVNGFATGSYLCATRVYSAF